MFLIYNNQLKENLLYNYISFLVYLNKDRNEIQENF